MATKTIPGNGQETSALAAVPPSNGPTRLDLRLAWARETLGVAPDATQAEVRQAFLAGLALDEFVPRETWSQAYQTLVNEFEGVVDVTDPAEFLRHEAEQLDEQIEQFAGRMFSLPVAARVREHEELCRRCLPESRALARLVAFRPGISADLAALGPNSPLFSELAKHLAELSILRPAERASRRFEILESLEPEISKWETAARIFKTQQPNLAALDESLVETLATWSKVEKKVSLPVIKADRSMVTQASGGTGWIANGRGAWLLILFVFLVMGGVFRGMSSNTRNTYVPKFDPKTYEYRPPDFRLPEEKPPSAKAFDELYKHIREQTPKTPDESILPGNPPTSPDTEAPPPVIDIRSLNDLREPLPKEGK